MMESKCDFSPLKEDIKDRLLQLNASIEALINGLDHNGAGCMLNEFQHLKKRFIDAESLASSFYLNCYLAPYTAKFDEISQAVTNLSQHRHGALLVIQRSDPVDQYITPGVRIAATLTHSLLESIFIPGSPLHDGAVVIHDDKIISAANVLPLTQRITEQKKLGTRHRAGLGLSELCDALVIVVSEETGRSSFSLSGILYPFSPGV